MVAEPRSPLDPARDAAATLRRLGVLSLMVALPLSAPLHRIGPVVALVAGVVLLVIAAGLDDQARRLRDQAEEAIRSTALLALALAIGWAALSLAWTPAPGWREAAGLAAVLGLGLAGIAALPARTRSANLYPMPVGAGALALVAIGLAAGYWNDEAEGRVRQMERVLAILVLCTWPAAAWLRSRGREVEALVLAAGTAVAAALGPGPAPIAAFAAGVLAHLAAQFVPFASRAVGLAAGALLLAAPALLALAPGSGFGYPSLAAAIRRWHDVLLADPARLITGHGLDSLASEPLLVALPGAPLLWLWYELGIVGVAAAAVAVASAAARIPGRLGPLAPSASAALVTAFVLGVADIGGGALWWPAALVTGILLFLAAERGQFRTRRPRALAELVMGGRSR